MTVKGKRDFDFKQLVLVVDAVPDPTGSRKALRRRALEREQTEQRPRSTQRLGSEMIFAQALN